MDTEFSLLDRLDLIRAIVEAAPEHRAGRTALMKCVYFLSVLRNVPVPYSFELYSYGPFDSDILDDLQYAESNGLISSELVHFPGGYGYNIRARSTAPLSPFVLDHVADIRWVWEKFGGHSAAELELISTIVFVDRTTAAMTLQDLSRRVSEVKPRFPYDRILAESRRLASERLLKSRE